MIKKVTTLDLIYIASDVLTCVEVNALEVKRLISGLCQGRCGFWYYKEGKMENRIFLMIFATCCLRLSGCVSRGMHRTELENWQTRTFDDIGITLELPRKSLLVSTYGVERWEKGKIEGCQLKFYWHMYGYGQLLTEPDYFAQWSFMRLTASQYQSFREGKHSLTGYWIWKDHHSQEYTNATFFAWEDFNHGNIYGWRRDYRANNGDVVVAGVSYMPLADWNDEIRAADSNAIVRVLNSVVID